MTIQEYQELSKRTLADLGSDELNLLHMKIGIMTEFGELLDSIKKHIAYKKPLDLVNVEEEIGDICFFIVGHMTFSDNKAVEWPTPPKYEPSNIANVATIIYDVLGAYIVNNIGNQSLLQNLYMISVVIGVDFFRGLENNIAKLQARYPEKFTEEQALNRNLEAERKILENG